MLNLLFILAGLSLLTSLAQSSEMPFLHLTVPEKIGANTNGGHVSERHVTYSIKIGKEKFTLLLERQSFLHPNFLIYSYNKSRTVYLDTSFLKMHCFYQGHVAEIRKSAVIVNTCFGLRGLLQLDNVTYGIEPLESLVTNEHMIYQIRTNEVGYSSLQEMYSLTKNAPHFYNIIVKSHCDFMGAEVALSAEKIVYMFGLINAMFSKVNITIMLSSLELWSDGNKISTHGDAEEILQNFLSWKQKPHGMSYLLIYREHAAFVGTTYHGTACDPKFATGVALYPKMLTLEAFSVVMVQLIGINLGLSYDKIHSCVCPGTTCVMNPAAIWSSGVKLFSSCNIEDFKHSVSQPTFACLQKENVAKVVYQGKNSVCGNGILETNEQCDCGVLTHCTHPKCCDAAECTLIGFAECGSGQCCDKATCLIATRGTLCRESEDPCDFPEYCNGTSEFCVPDVRAANYQPCANKTAFCFKGKCRDRDTQCAEVFGIYASGSHYLCGQEVNSLNDRFGVCDGGRCSQRNSLCGNLVCSWRSTDLIRSKTYDYQYTFYRDQLCVSAAAKDNSRTGRNIVQDGTMCNQNSAIIWRFLDADLGP
ncbi:A disintegrin and metallopeptidase domain 3-like [Ochotona princeps]|uniref:A disintegrin and metallopeptidase domain 3-like n=1 Tax=Ochotona princeps TaxID=9978 RepID=UPI0027148DDD|nr:A disintegrin and metallopeptidase domain 3-like [Ochotona princeps]